MTIQSTKTYGCELGFSAAFRQHRAPSHCKFLHGYSLGFKFVFEAEVLNECNWVVDFGDLDDLKTQLRYFFDHKTIVAEDDPLLHWFQQGAELGALQLILTDKAGCEAFAEIGWTIADNLMRTHGWAPRCRVVSCEVFEHGANSAVYFGGKEQV